MKPPLARHRLFAYGTLQLPERLQALIGRVPPMSPARLREYRSGLVERADFPGLVPCADAVTEGMLLTGITESELQVLDEYEGELYRRILVHVEAGREPVDTWVYIIVPWARRRVTTTPWTLERYRSGKRRLTYRA